MAYEKTVWVNGQAPALDAEHLNKIEQGIADAVSVTPQTLSDKQKAQARGNIDAAPGGFGWGNSVGQFILDANEAILGGFYYWGPDAKNTPFRYGAMVVIPRSSSTNKPNITQIASQDTGDFTPHAFIAVRKSTDSGDGMWGPWEWVNPPMELGVEYRTTERYLGKPVYAKAVDCGQIADGKEVEHGIDNMLYCIFAQGLRGGMPMPVIFNHNLSDPWSCYISHVTSTKVRFECGTSAAGGNCAVLFKYIKTTD